MTDTSLLFLPNDSPLHCSISTTHTTDYQRFLDLFMIIAIGLSTLLFVFRLTFRTTSTPSSFPRTSSQLLKHPSTKERLESELRVSLPRQSSYYSLTSTKQEWIEDDVIEGWIFIKKGIQRGKTWKKRYLVVDGNGRIQYYIHAEAARKNTNLKGSFTIHAVKPADPSLYGSNTLEVRGTLGGTYYLRTEDRMMTRKWLCILTKRAIQGCVPGRIDALPSINVITKDSDEITCSTVETLSTTLPLRSHTLKAKIQEMNYTKEASLRQFYVVVKYKSELHDHSCVPVGQTIPTSCEKGNVTWNESLSWHFVDHHCMECRECRAIGSTNGTFKGIPDRMVFQIYEIHLRYLTTKIGQVVISLKELYGFLGIQQAQMTCQWPIISNMNTILGQLTLTLDYQVDITGETPVVPFLITTEMEREILGEYEIHPSIRDCNQFYQLYYANHTSLHRWERYHRIRGDTEVEVGEWKDSEEYGGQIRTITSRALTNASIGPATTATTTTHHIPEFPIDPNRLVIESRVFLHDIPYGDCFSVESVLTIENINGLLKARASLGIPFSKGCMFKSKIISATKEQMSTSMRLLLEEFYKSMDSTTEITPFLQSTEDERTLLGEYSLPSFIQTPLQFYQLFYSDGIDSQQRWQSYYQISGDMDHQVGEWKESKEYGGMIRSISYRAKNNAALGPASTAAEMEQHVMLPSDEEEDVMIENKLSFLDVPYGDCFSVETKYIVTSSQPLIIVRVWIAIQFSKSTMFKSKIASATKEGIAKATKQFFDTIPSVLDQEQGTKETSVDPLPIDRYDKPRFRRKSKTHAQEPRCLLFARVNSTLDGSVALEEVFENQRISIFAKWGPNHLLPTDRSRFTNRQGDIPMSFEQVELPTHWIWTSPWKIDKNYTDCDEEGWSYATDFPRFKTHLARGKSTRKSLGCSVRRRRWIRMMAYVPPTDQSGSEKTN